MGRLSDYINSHQSSSRNSSGRSGGFGIEIEMNQAFFEKEEKMLRSLMLLDTSFEKRLRDFIAQEIKEARNSIVSQIKFENGDPRGARHSIRRIVYDKILGGAIVIPPQTKASTKNDYEPPRKLTPKQRGGNRIIRSLRTDDIMHYGPLDRGWILRMVNAGTHPRYANGRNGRWDKKGMNRTFFRLQREGDYYRGSIAPRNFFHDYGNRAVSAAIQNIRRMVDEEYERIINNN